MIILRDIELPLITFAIISLVKMLHHREMIISHLAGFAGWSQDTDFSLELVERIYIEDLSWIKPQLLSGVCVVVCLASNLWCFPALELLGGVGGLNWAKLD